jgi:hypothetical protein
MDDMSDYELMAERRKKEIQAEMRCLFYVSAIYF